MWLEIFTGLGTCGWFQALVVLKNLFPAEDRRADKNFDILSNFSYKIYYLTKVFRVAWSQWILYFFWCYHLNKLFLCNILAADTRRCVRIRPLVTCIFTVELPTILVYIRPSSWHVETPFSLCTLHLYCVVASPQLVVFSLYAFFLQRAQHST